MAKTREKIIEEIMKEAASDGEPVTREEAEEMADMEIKARGIKIYNQSESPRKKATRERKVDEVKKEILMAVKESLENELDIDEVEMKNEVELNFKYGDGEFSLKLTRHRPKKDA